MSGLLSGMAIGFVAAALMFSGRSVVDTAHTDTIREVAQLTADCIDKLPKSFAKQHCLAEWDRVIRVEATR